MTRTECRLSWSLGLRMLAAGGLLCAGLGAADTGRPRLYQVQTELGMPHLEENLRYGITREKRCLTQEQLEVSFPALDHPSMNDCHLAARKQDGSTVSYALDCSGGHGTTGSAIWHVGTDRLTGVLHVKLGGKNMTFFERVTAKPLGRC